MSENIEELLKPRSSSRYKPIDLSISNVVRLNKVKNSSSFLLDLLLLKILLKIIFYLNKVFNKTSYKEQISFDK